MAVDFRRWAKWGAATSFVLLLVALASVGNAMDEMIPLLDPEQENVARLESGEAIVVELDKNRYYVALRTLEDGKEPESEARLIDTNGEEIEGKAPTSLHVDRVLEEDGPKYRPVWTYYLDDSANYTLHNDGNSALWLVDDAAAEKEIFTNPVVLLMFSTCCFGLIIGLLAIIFAIISTRQNPRKEEKVVSGLVIDGRVMTTDELYRMQKGEEVSDSSFTQEKVADPFVSSGAGAAKQKIIQQDLDSEINETEWKEWDEG
mgnify:CR=1 FL=1